MPKMPPAIDEDFASAPPMPESFMPIPARRFSPVCRGEAIPGRCPPVTGPETEEGADARTARGGRTDVGLGECGAGPSLDIEGEEEREEREAWN